MTHDPYVFTCRHCGCAMDERTETVWQLVQGYEKKRAQGGTNHVALRRPLYDFMCNRCMTLAQSGLHPQQGDLFDVAISGNS